MERLLDRDNLDKGKLTDLAEALAAGGYRVVAPVREGDLVRLAVWAPGTPIETAALPVNSAKDFLLPRSEVIARYRLAGDDFEPLEVPIEAVKTVLLAVRPCDAAAVAALDAVFHWDYDDAFYNARRQATTFVTLACAAADDECFCTTVGGRPDSTAGADAVLRPAGGGAALVFEPLTDKGRAVAEAGASVLADGEAEADPPPSVPVRFDLEAVQAWCRENFESDLWAEVSRACLGCGACAYACPTCHCFDIQDESTPSECFRLRNWDACGFGLFTLHASGHNPRANQAARWRQRVLHKFSYFPERFGMIACTGCGRCGRLCGAGMAISEVGQIIDQACKAAAK